MNSITSKIEEVLSNCNDGRYIFRGEDFCYKRVTSSLYRQYGKGAPISTAEQELVAQAKRHIRPDATNIEVLTTLQHLGADTTLIDFTQNLLVALFFACDGQHNEDGRIVLVNTDDFEIKSNIDYTQDTAAADVLMPSGKSPRVIFQSSIFIRVRQGFLPEAMYKVIVVEKNIKKDILNHLEKKFNICDSTIYDDIQGFIFNQQHTTPAAIKHWADMKKNKKTIQGDLKAIRLGFTTNLSESKRRWQSKYPKLYNWKRLRTCQSKTEAQKIASQLAKKQGSQSVLTSNGPEHDTWYVYRFEYEY